jgi:FkbM family methyltransferase
VSAKDTVVSLLRRLTGAHIYRILPRGLDLLHDLRNSFPGHRVEIIFDVGANVGQSVERFLPWYAGARVYCFEPVGATFRRLTANVAGEPRVQCLQMALGTLVGNARMIVGDRSDMSHLVVGGDGATASDETAETVAMSTVDKFCDDHGIGRIHYLKIDAEGADLDVLIGAESMLRAERVDIIEVEAGMNRTNTRHVAWQSFESFLADRGYLLFGVYEQVTEWPTGEPQLRRANLAFISSTMSRTAARGSPTG